MRKGTRRRFEWTESIGRSARLIIAARALRAFAQGFLSVLLGLYLAEKGLGLRSLGLFFSAGVLGGATYAAALRLAVQRMGERRTLIGLTLLSALFSVGLLLTDRLGLLMLFAFLGSLAGVGGAGGAGPSQPLEQALLAEGSADRDRASLFAVYRFVGTAAMALGGLAAGIPTWLGRAADVGMRSAQEGMIVVFALCLLGVALVYSQLPERAASGESAPPPTRPLRTTPSRGLILRLNALFGVDQLASSLTTAPLMAYWFHTRFGLELDALALLSFGSQALAALSMWGSVHLSARIGYVRTMVYTHIPASLMLVGVALVPQTGFAIALWLARSALSQMDIPARDALTMSVVAPEERVTMASVHLVSRNAAGTLGPTLSTVLWHSVSAAAPLIGCGLLKVAYDVTLFAMYRNVSPHRP